MNVTVAFCCNDDRGDFTGKVVELDIAQDIRLAGPARGMRIDEQRMMVRVGRVAFRIRGKMLLWVGNIFWNALGMEVDEAKRLATYLLANGWAVEEWTHGSPFAELAGQAP